MLVFLDPASGPAPGTGSAGTITGWTNGAHGTVSCTAAGACTYRPDANYHGPDEFTYTVSDGTTTTTLAVPVTVTPVNDRPVATSDALVLYEDTRESVAVLTNDSDVDGGALRVVARTHGRHGTVWCTMAGACTYTPARDWYGRDAFTYTVGDGMGGTATGPVNVGVRGVADRPGPPRIGRATSGSAGGPRTITCRWWPPLSNGGAPITSYRATALRLNSANRVVALVNQVVDDTWRAARFTLPAGRYQCMVAATNAVGTGRLSARSNIVGSQ
jgi:VCBS repeat-containing protein